MSRLVWSEILRLFVNTLTADNKYSRCNVENFAQQVQRPLSQNQRTFYGFFIAFLKSARHHYYPIFPCIWDILSWRKSAIVWSELLRLFVNTLTGDYKYSRCNVHNFAQQVQTPLSQKQKTFWEIFIAFLKCAWNLEHFEKKDECPSLIISEIMDCERGGYLNV